MSLLVGSTELARFDFVGRDFQSEKAIIASELYWRDGWRLAAVGQGFRGGLSAVLKHFGGIEDRTTSSALSHISPQPPQTSQKEVQAALEQFRLDFAVTTAKGALSNEQWQSMWTRFNAQRQSVDRDTVLQYLRADALSFMERLATMVSANGIVTPNEESYIAQMFACFGIPAQQQAPILSRLGRIKDLSRIREGHLPSVGNSEQHWDAGEICHLEVEATYLKVGTSSVKQMPGKLLATSKRLVFISPAISWTIQYKNILRVEATSSDINLELSTRSGHGRYTVPDVPVTEAIIIALTRIAKRQQLSANDDRPSRYIPQDVRNTVWQRDGGRCVQCHASSYLEYDHVIPHSKGGANTEGNVQLLCRNCNLAKGNRI